MKIYKNRLKYFTFFHILTLILTGIISTDQLYSKYNEVKPTKAIEKIYKFQYNVFSQGYYRLTGTETGFGFFAPNVKSNGFLLPEFCNSKQDFSLLTNEGNSRFSTLVANATDYLTTRTKNKNESVNKYNELIIKNIALSVLSRTKLKCRDVKLSYYVIDYPSLGLIKKEDKVILPNLIKIQSWTYGINN